MPAGYADMCSAIAGTISYEIDEESVQSSKKNAEGSVDVTWTLVDYEAVFEQVSEDGGDVDAITAATISSRAFCDAVNRALSTFENNKGGF
jgi:Na+-translocating ferredoxin:NAD+ oxidoreductase RnfG subunit